MYASNVFQSICIPTSPPMASLAREYGASPEGNQGQERGGRGSINSREEMRLGFLTLRGLSSGTLNPFRGYFMTRSGMSALQKRPPYPRSRRGFTAHQLS